MSHLDAVHWIALPSHRDERGVLTAVEGVRDIPFAVKRVFYMHQIVADRAGHAHPDTDELVIAVSGALEMILSDGQAQCHYRLDDPTRGLFVPRMTFIELKNFTPDAVCLVLANTYYDVEPLRGWETYLRAREQESTRNRLEGLDHD